VLFEAGLADRFDAVLVVTASEDVRRARVAARGQDFAARSARQMGEAEKVARADAAYVNDGDLRGLREWVADRYAEYSGRSCDAPIDRH
jgi:dephospho-CoA kinase